jgi:alpha-tubulin suppressor-like RCC1 family protein
MTTKILGTQIENFSIDTAQLAANVTVNFVNKSLLTTYANAAVFAEVANALAPKITTVSYANSAFTVLDDTAVNTGGGYIVITGENFQNGATVIVDNTSASAVTYVNSNVLNVQVPTKSAASYNLYVVNPNGGTGIRTSGITYSGTPTWVTSSLLTTQVNNAPFAITLSATGATSYTVANGYTLPAGTALLSNGYFYGTVTVASETLYSFNVVATDAELQDSIRAFGLTVQLAPPRYLWSWGLGGLGLGLPDTISRSSPTQIGTDNDWASYSQYATTSVAIKTTGALWAWGSNSYGQFGRNNTISTSSPVQIGTGTDWSVTAISGYGVVFAIKTNGTLWASGSGTYGISGRNTQSSCSSPIQIGADTNWSKIYSDNSSVGIKTNGTLWVWGRNLGGNLGNNSILHRSSPAQIGTDTNWSVAAQAGSGSVHAIKTTGALWAWGRNSYQGQLGLNGIGNNRSSPVQVGTDTNWSKIAGAYDSMAAIRTTGTLWSWGNNNYGQLGIGSMVSRSSPTQIGALTNWSAVQGQQGGFLAIKTDGTLWAWGQNNGGQLGLNNTTNRNSPVQIGSRLWSLPNVLHGLGASQGMIIGS